MRWPITLIAGLSLFAACKRSRGAAECPAPQRQVDAGRRVRTIAEVPPPGRSIDRRELDVRLSWIHLLANPVATGSAPSVVIGAELPCGYRARWANTTRVGDELRVRLRARWDRDDAPPPARPSPCPTSTPSVQIVSLSVVRLGRWRVTDASAGDAGAGPVAELVVEADDGHLPPPVVRWFRPCRGDRDCGAGGSVCARAGRGTLCLPPIDPWRWSGQGCVDGATAREVTAVSDPSRRWSACLADCDHGRCPAPLVCDDSGSCVPDPSTPRDAGSVEGLPRHDR